MRKYFAPTIAAATLLVAACNDTAAEEQAEDSLEAEGEALEEQA